MIWLPEPSCRDQVLQPAGFVTDAHASVMNNIETMKFIPVVPARVSCGVDAE
ncbi:TPA: hypothetical protein RY435_001290 [Escherichia albertii]|nr:hypothetical protein [Escherichia albertii]HAX3031029.1 hypothetical protein [Escherichia albertii]HAX3199274.1 hypothetical protein [Escherichia albertii]HAX3200645.1 hypothetical protein [Escherichia albertii]HEB1527765.1 hypothetical protein [Escherichia albertii]